MKQRLLLLAGALLVAVLGTTLVFSYSAKQAPQANAAEPQTRVLVARADIPAGTTGQAAVEQKLVALTDMPARLVPAGALVDIVAVREQEAASDIAAGEVLMPSRFVSTTLAGSIEIPDDKVAISVEVANAQRVAGFVRPGLDVAVFDTYEVHEPQQGSRGGAALPKVEHATRLLLPRATIIAVGPTALRTVGAAKSPGGEDEAEPKQDEDLMALVTLAVSVDDAQKLAHAAQTGEITLSLLSKQSRTGTPAADDNRTLFD